MPSCPPRPWRPEEVGVLVCVGSDELALSGPTSASLTSGGEAVLAPEPAEAPPRPWCTRYADL